VVLSTHAIKGLSMLDMVLAAKIDALVSVGVGVGCRQTPALTRFS
jgi:hypothetical protein